LLAACSNTLDDGAAIRLVGAGGYSPFGNGPGSNVEWIDFPVQKNATDPGSWGPVLLDIERHLPSSYGTQYQDSSKMTWGHETTHGINSHVRNYLNKTGGKANGFYVLENKAVVIAEPNMYKNKVAAFIPQSLRGYRFSLYITGQTAWDDTPLYIFDEWVAYVNGGAVGVDLVNRGLFKDQPSDGVSGALEFTVYALGLALAIEKHDPQYLASNTQFREFLAWQLERAMKVFRAGKEMAQLPSSQQAQMYERLQTHPDAAPMRALCVKLYGQAFTEEVLGLSVAPPAPDAGGPPPPKSDQGNVPPPLKPDTGGPLPPDGGGSPPPPPPPTTPDAGLSPDAGGTAPPPPTPPTPPTPPGPDMAPPSVTISQPGEGSTMGPSFTLEAAVKDNVGVARVELLIDGKPMAQRTVAPYNFPVTLLNGKHVLLIAAYDAVGNRGKAAVGFTVKGGQDAARPKGDFGEVCDAPKECKSNLCAEDVKSSLRYCTESCLPSGGAGACPTSSTCLPTTSGVYVCGPTGSAVIPAAPEEPAPGSDPDPSVRPVLKDGGMCSLGGTGASSSPWMLLFLLAFVSLRRRRAR
jgi:hypothetical protein